MRETKTWEKSLARALAEETALSSSEIAMLCDVELGLVLLEALAPDETAVSLIPLLSGFVYQWSGSKAWSAEQGHMLGIGRQLLQFYRGRQRWEEVLIRYISLPERFRLFRLEEPAAVARCQEISVCPNRIDVYRMALSTSLERVRRKARFAAPGNAYFYEQDGVVKSVTFPAWIPMEAARDIQDKRARERPEQGLRVRWEDLKATAEWMDQRHVGRQWVRDFSRVRLHFPVGSKTPAQEFEIRDTTHIVGMVGAGKSTLMDILAVWAARSGLRITLIVGDVVDAMTRASCFEISALKQCPSLVLPIVQNG